jgi:hypothetical protein
MMTHFEHSKKVNPVRPCSAHHLTFGGRGLNCGYDPAKVLLQEARRVTLPKKEEKEGGQDNA